MKSCFAYVRVSTQKQGTHGVSLQEQKSAIELYAAKNDIEISRWFEELQTAAKTGRPVFDDMLKRLRKKEAGGVVIHKIDRSARNFRDWAAVGDLIDAGVEFHFAVDGLDLASRGGRLAADIQAVVAADYIRNLSMEARKGFIGRLKQGYYPLAAPFGYLDMGGGKTKEIDPINGQLVKRAYEIYATGQYSIETLQKRLKLKNRKSGKLLSKHAVSKILRNPFYISIMTLPKTGERFRGNHTSLITKRLFEDVQEILNGKIRRKANRHSYLYARVFKCGHCKYALTAETQKSNIYYRCHTRKCPTLMVREEQLELIIEEFFQTLTLSNSGLMLLKKKVSELTESCLDDEFQQASTSEMQLQQTNSQLDRLTDAFVDGLIDKQVFNERRLNLEIQRDNLKAEIASRTPQGTDLGSRVEKFFELLESPIFSQKTANQEEKLKLLKIMSSNRMVIGKKAQIEPREPWLSVQNFANVPSSGPERHRLTYSRMVNKIFEMLRSDSSATANLSYSESKRFDASN